MLFGTTDHGALLRLASQSGKRWQYVVGNPLFALEMTSTTSGRACTPRCGCCSTRRAGENVLDMTGHPRCSASFQRRPDAPGRRHVDRKLEALVAAAVA